MDAYNGVAWGFGTDSRTSGDSGDVFRRYGSTIQVRPSGPAIQLKVTIGELGSIWVPEAGDISHISFSGPDSGRLADAFRYDTDTETAVEPIGLNAGDTYTESAYLPVVVASPAALDAAAAGTIQIPVTGVPPQVQADANSWSAGAHGAYLKVMALAGHLKEVGYFSDGLENPTLSLPGHSYGRVLHFLQGGGLVGSEIVGDGEQYAATLALMANAIGVPARVVLGAPVGNGGVVTGAGVMALSRICWTQAILLSINCTCVSRWNPRAS